MKSVLLFMGSPRQGGNTDLLSDAFLQGAKEAGGEVTKIYLYKKEFLPCVECGGCDESGECILKDDMTALYDNIQQADIIVVASPMFFYNITAKTQALVERSQALWIRKYVLKQAVEKEKQGVFLSVGATKGKMLFDGSIRVIRYFLDAVGAKLTAGLMFRGIEAKGAIKEHPCALKSARALGAGMVTGSALDEIEEIYLP